MTEHAIRDVIEATSQHLSRQTEVLRRLSDEVEALQPLLVARDADQIRRVASRIEGFTKPMQSLRIERDELRGRIAEVLRVPQDRANVSALAQVADATQARRLCTARDEVRSLAEQIDYRTRVNAVIIRRSMERGEHVFQQIVSVSLASDRYRADGKRAAPMHGSIFQAKG